MTGSKGDALAIGVFAKAPIPGKTKTRLIPAVGEDGAALLHRAFLDDTLRSACRVARVTLFVTEPHAALQELANAHGVSIEAQHKGDLGMRMLRALEALRRNAGTAVLLGSDSPTLPCGYIAAAGIPDLAFGPSADGGFYTVAGRVHPDFEGVPWSSRSTLAQALKRNPTATVLPPWFDVDTPDDLRLLRAQLLRNTRAAPATAEALAQLDARPR